MSTPARRVAVVDDDAAVLDSVCFLLEVEGHSAQPFVSGPAFLEALDPDRFDCVILDQHMPGLTGLELAQRLRATGNTLPIMLISGAVTPEILGKAAAIRLDKVAEKPVSSELLVGFVEQARAC